jgi:hypothetical protein
MRSKWVAAAGAALAVGLAASAAAQQRHPGWHGPGGHGPGWHAGWHVIGHKIVNSGSDTDWIYTPGARRYRQLRLCAYNAPLHMRDFDVYFANGGHQDVRTRDRLAPGTCTREIDLNGRARDITRIRLKYGRIARGFQAPLVRVSAR